jgi:hypothetical protein
MREAENLRAILDARSIALVPTPLTSSIDFSNIISFATMLVPQLMTWGDIGQILSFLDLLFVNGYSKQVKALPPRQHKNPVFLPTSQLVVYGVFAFLSTAKCLFLLAFHINVIPLRTGRKVRLGRITNGTGPFS